MRYWSSLAVAAAIGSVLGAAVIAAVPRRNASSAYAAASQQALASQVASLTAQVDALNKKVAQLEEQVKQLQPHPSFSMPIPQLPYQMAPSNPLLVPRSQPAPSYRQPSAPQIRPGPSNIPSYSVVPCDGKAPAGPT